MGLLWVSGWIVVACAAFVLALRARKKRAQRDPKTGRREPRESLFNHTEPQDIDDTAPAVLTPPEWEPPARASAVSKRR
jgi:hypothetical protein